jgi:hypothetical protein
LWRGTYGAGEIPFSVARNAAIWSKTWSLTLMQNAIDVVLQSVAATVQFGEEFRQRGRHHDVFECMHSGPRPGFTNLTGISGGTNTHQMNREP